MAVLIACSCGKQLKVPEDLLGRKVRCPACNAVMVASADGGPAPPPPRHEDPEAAGTQASGVTPRRSTANPAPLPTYDDPEATNEPTREEQPRPQKKHPAMRPPPKKADGGFFGPEKAGISYGVVGGMAMMGIAVVWFVGGLFFDIIFFYPPILFLIGLFAFFKGIFTGNIAGNRE